MAVGLTKYMLECRTLAYFKLCAPACCLEFLLFLNLKTLVLTSAGSCEKPISAALSRYECLQMPTTLEQKRECAKYSSRH